MCLAFVSFTKNYVSEKTFQLDFFFASRYNLIYFESNFCLLVNKIPENEMAVKTAQRRLSICSCCTYNHLEGSD